MFKVGNTIFFEDREKEYWECINPNCASSDLEIQITDIKNSTYFEEVRCQECGLIFEFHHTLKYCGGSIKDDDVEEKKLTGFDVRKNLI